MTEYSINILRFIFLTLGPVTYAMGKNYNVLNCQGSPVDFVPELVKGRAATSLPSTLLDLQLSVEMNYVERDGIAVLQLTPVLKDEKKCVDYPTGNLKLCYEYSEVHWGRTKEEGSDHAVGGYNYPMEVQHYFHRTNSTHSLMPLAVGVLFQEMSNDSLPHPSETSEGAFSEIHEKYPSFMNEKKRLTLGLARLLPNQMEEKPFYHYRGPVTGQCGPERDWIVFEDPLEVVPSFLSFLKFLNEKDNLNHHFPPVSRNACYLYSHYSEETDGDDCGFSEAVARTVTPGNKSGNSLDNLLGKSKHVRESMTAVNTSDYVPLPTPSSDPTAVEADKAGVFSSKFGDYSTSPQFDSVSTHSLDSRTVMAKTENVGIFPKETTPLLPQSASSFPVSTDSAEIGEGGITFKETPHPTLPTASSTESSQPYRTKVKSTNGERDIPSNETLHTTSSYQTSTKLTRELLEPTSIEQPLHSSDNGELGSLSTFIYSVTFEHTSSTVEDDQAETSPQEGIEPELITAPEHYVRERPDGSGASTGRLASELPLFVFLISRILFG